eukprot:gene6453-305_t
MARFFVFALLLAQMFGLLAVSANENDLQKANRLSFWRKTRLGFTGMFKCPVVRKLPRYALRQYLLNKVPRLPACLGTPVIGQHIAVDAVTNAITLFQENRQKKPVVMFLAGPAGVGKTFLQSHLYDLLFGTSLISGNEAGMLFLGGGNFHAQDISPLEVQRTIASQLLKCSRSIIVIDELQMIPSRLVPAIYLFLDAQQPVTIDDIQVNELLQAGHQRDDIHERDLEPLLRSILKTTNNWLGYKGIVDVYVPFLPMAVHQVKELILSKFREYECLYKVILDVNEDVIDFLVQQVPFTENGFTRFGLSNIEEPLLLMEIKGPLQDTIEFSLCIDSAGQCNYLTDAVQN